MTPAATPEALIDGADDMPTEAEIEAMREEAENFRLPAPPPIPVRDPYYLTECEHCGWIGSSEHCGNGGYPDYDDVICPVCCSSMLGDGPSEADTAKHGEAVYQRIIAAEAALATATAEAASLRAENDRLRVACVAAQKSIARFPGSVHDRAMAKIDKALGVVPSNFADPYEAEAVRLRAEVEAKDRALKEERARRKAAVSSVREKAAALCDEAAAYFDRTTGHYDRQQAAGGYRATAAKIRLLTPDRTALARAATAGEG